MVKEQKFEKVVKWKRENYIYRPLIVFGVLMFFSIFIFIIIITNKVPAWDHTFSPVGWILIFYICSLFLSIFSMFKRSVHWRKI